MRLEDWNTFEQAALSLFETDPTVCWMFFFFLKNQTENQKNKQKKKQTNKRHEYALNIDTEIHI